jgi:hypothetical protein
MFKKNHRMRTNAGKMVIIFTSWAEGGNRMLKPGLSG